MTVHKLVSRRIKNAGKLRRSPVTKSPQTHTPSPDLHPPASLQETANEVASFTPKNILQLQKTIGNHATLQRLSLTRKAHKSTAIAPDILQRTLEAAPVLSQPLT